MPWGHYLAMHPSRRWPILPQAALLPLLLLSAGTARAQDQLVAFDETYVATEKGNIGGESFHWKILPKPTEPASWTAPVNYARGTAYIYLEVLEKPSERNTALTICFDGNLEGYGCIATKTYTSKGVVETKLELPTATWQYNKIAWGKKRQEYHLVIKDPGLGGTPGGKPASDYVPTKLRVVLTIVPPGGTYTPPPGAAAPVMDAGTPTDAPTTPPPTPDAGPPPSTDPKPDAASTPPMSGPPSPAPGSGGAPPSSGSGGTSGAGGAMTTPPSPPPSNGNSNPSGNAGSGVSGGCSYGGAAPGAAGLFGMALALASLRRRRR